MEGKDINENQIVDAEFNKSTPTYPTSQNKSNYSKWVETKKELEKDESGQWVEKKMTIELSGFRKKEKIDLFIRVLALTAILIPFLLFFLQQKREQIRQKNLLKLETYISTSKALRTILTKDLDSDASKEAVDDLNLMLYPKIKFIDDEFVVKNLDTVKEAINFLVDVHSLNKNVDTILLPAGWDRFFTNYLLNKNRTLDLIKQLKLIKDNPMVKEMRGLALQKDTDKLSEITDQLLKNSDWVSNFKKTIDTLSSKLDSTMLKSVLASSN